MSRGKSVAPSTRTLRRLQEMRQERLHQAALVLALFDTDDDAVARLSLIIACGGRPNGKGAEKLNRRVNELAEDLLPMVMAYAERRADA